MASIESLLEKHGPTRSSRLSQILRDEGGVKAEAARKRIARIKAPVHRFPVQIFPKGESFLYLAEQRNTERFFSNLQRDLRESSSVFGAALDGLAARHGIVRQSEFAVISGAPSLLRKRHVSAASVAERLMLAGLILQSPGTDGENVFQLDTRIEYADREGMAGRRRAESIVLDAVREWARKLGLASYNRLAIRGEENLIPISGYQFDLSGPSYLMPLRKTRNQPGFLVADVFVGRELNEHAIAYFIRKAQGVAALTSSGLLPILVADSFTAAALTKGHAAGIIMATPKTLFGPKVAYALQTLLETLNKAAAYASSSPDRLTALLDDLSVIEGRAGNLIGAMFEFIVAYLARISAVSIDMGVRARGLDGKSADIDVLAISNQSAECRLIECKAKQPGTDVSLEEVQDWVRRFPIFKEHIRSKEHLREAKIVLEFWASGSIDDDATAFLLATKKSHTKIEVRWFDGQAVLAKAVLAKEKKVAESIRHHFLKHPYQQFDEQGFNPQPASAPALLATTTTSLVWAPPKY